MPAPRRIVSLAPSNTEIIAALGLMDRLVGVDDWSDWPEQVSGLPRVGPDLQIDLDRVEALQPDLVLASLSVPGMERNVEGLQQRGLPHIVLDPHCLSGIWADIRMVGECCGVAARAEEAVASLQARVEAVQAAAQARMKAAAPARGEEPPVRLYWEWWPRPIYTPGRRNWLTEISRCAGCVNIFADCDTDSVRVDDPLEVVRRRPDIILLAWTGAKRPHTRHVYRRPGWEALEALQRGRVHIMEEGLFNRPSPRLVDGLEQLWSLLEHHSSAGKKGPGADMGNSGSA